MMKRVVLLFVCAQLLTGGSCDQTVLAGTIEAQKTTVATGERLQLELVLPAELDGVHRIFWEVTPAGCATIEAVRHPALPPKKLDKRDRRAVFTGTKAGPCTVQTSGFYRQTNPQPITTLVVTVAP